jgi:hypothetical protein
MPRNSFRKIAPIADGDKHIRNRGFPTRLDQFRNDRFDSRSTFAVNDSRKPAFDNPVEERSNGRANV